jgi:hypothetical protein
VTGDDEIERSWPEWESHRIRNYVRFDQGSVHIGIVSA